MKEELKELAMRVDGQFKMAPLPIVCYDLQMEKDYIALYEYIGAATPANILMLIESHEAVEQQRVKLQAKYDKLLAAAKKAHSRIGKKNDGDFDAMCILESAITKAEAL